MPAERGELRVGGGVAERVGQPDAVVLDAELLEEEPLAVDELPGHGLAAGQVAVGLDPHAADRAPTARSSTASWMRSKTSG